MVNIKKNIIFLNKHSFIYTYTFYKIKSVFFKKTLKQNKIWKWPLINESLILNNYITFF